MKKRNSKYFNYRKDNHCVDCGKSINDHAERCKSCGAKKRGFTHKLNCNCPFCRAKRGLMKGKNNGRFIDGRYLKKYFCIDCGKEISKMSGIYGNCRCGSCSQRRKKLSKKTKIKMGKASKLNWKNKEYKKRNQTKLIKHHLYGKLFKNIIAIPRKIHKTLHSQAYFYILDKFGKKGIKKYLKWFEKKYNIKLEEKK